MGAQLDQLLERSSKVGFYARIPASITIATEVRALGGKLLWNKGGEFAKINTINFACFLAFAVNGSVRNQRLKALLAYDFYFTIYRNNRLSAVALLQER